MDRPLLGGGVPLAGGWRACLCELRGDWQYYAEVFHFPYWNQAERACWICAASATVAALLFTTVTPGAGWRRTRYSHESYLEMMRRTGKEVPLLLQKVLGLRQNTGTSYKAWALEGGTLPSPKEGRRDAAAHFFIVIVNGLHMHAHRSPDNHVLV